MERVIHHDGEAFRQLSPPPSKLGGGEIVFSIQPHWTITGSPNTRLEGAEKTWRIYDEFQN